MLNEVQNSKWMLNEMLDIPGEIYLKVCTPPNPKSLVDLKPEKQKGRRKSRKKRIFLYE